MTQPFRRYSLYALGLLAITNLLSFVNRNVVFALFEPIKQELAISDAQLGWLASAYVLVFSLAALPFGIISDLRSRRAVITTGVVLWSAFTLASGFATGFSQLLLRARQRLERVLHLAQVRDHRYQQLDLAMHARAQDCP